MDPLCSLEDSTHEDNQANLQRGARMESSMRSPSWSLRFPSRFEFFLFVVWLCLGGCCDDAQSAPSAVEDTLNESQRYSESSFILLVPRRYRVATLNRKEKKQFEISSSIQNWTMEKRMHVASTVFAVVNISVTLHQHRECFVVAGVVSPNVPGYKAATDTTNDAALSPALPTQARTLF